MSRVDAAPKCVAAQHRDLVEVFVGKLQPLGWHLLELLLYLCCWQLVWTSTLPSLDPLLRFCCRSFAPAQPSHALLLCC